MKIENRAFRNPASEVMIDYLNHRGDHVRRRIAPASIFWGETEWYPGERQWFLLALDLDRNVERAYAVKNIRAWQPVDPADGGAKCPRPSPSP